MARFAHVACLGVLQFYKEISILAYALLSSLGYSAMVNVSVGWGSKQSYLGMTFFLLFSQGHARKC